MGVSNALVFSGTDVAKGGSPTTPLTLTRYGYPPQPPPTPIPSSHLMLGVGAAESQPRDEWRGFPSTTLRHFLPGWYILPQSKKDIYSVMLLKYENVFKIKFFIVLNIAVDAVPIAGIMSFDPNL